MANFQLRPNGDKNFALLAKILASFNGNFFRLKKLCYRVKSLENVWCHQAKFNKLDCRMHRHGDTSVLDSPLGCCHFGVVWTTHTHSLKLKQNLLMFFPMDLFKFEPTVIFFLTLLLSNFVQKIRTLFGIPSLNDLINLPNKLILNKVLWSIFFSK